MNKSTLIWRVCVSIVLFYLLTQVNQQKFINAGVAVAIKEIKYATPH